MDITHLRQNYSAKALQKNELLACPFAQFEKWFKEAIDEKVYEPNAMALATASKKSIPSCRMVLLKQFDLSGFYFFTNYESRKGLEMTENPLAALNFWWKEMDRQVIIEGFVEKVCLNESEKYFKLRPRKSQISALISCQDKIIESRDELEKDFMEAEEKFLGKEIPMPKRWGGFLVIPERFEFWQGRQDRLHDRFQYVKNGSTLKMSQFDWMIDRLSP